MHTILLIPGDGIGLEVIPAAEKLLRATGLPLELSHADAGWDTFQKVGRSVPDETLEQVKAADATLAGAFTSPSGSQKVPGFQGAIRYLRRTLDLYANLRPAKSRPIPGSMQNVDMLMVRENTQGLYVEQERRYGDVAIADAVITKGASERIARTALQEAQKRRKELAVVHKANVLPLTTGLFLESAMTVAKDFPDVRAYDIIVDAAAMKLVEKQQGHIKRLEESASVIRHLEELDRVRATYFQAASHDLRAPLGGIKASCQGLLKGLFGELTAEQAETIEGFYLFKDRSFNLGKLFEDFRVVSRSATKESEIGKSFFITTLLGKPTGRFFREQKSDWEE